MAHHTDSTTTDVIADGYRAETLELLANRLRTGIVVLLVSATVIAGLEAVFFPGRWRALLAVFVAYLAVSLGAYLAVRRVPAWTFPITVLAVDAAGLLVMAYVARVRSPAEMQVASLTLFLTGMVLLFPWGIRGQILGSLGAVIGYPLAVALGTPHASPLPYGMFVLGAALGLTLLGAHLLDTARFVAYRRSAERQRAEQFATALLNVARALSSTIADPQALATQLSERTREATGADWVILYTKGDERDFRVAAISGAPPELVDELRAIGLTPEFLPALPRAGSDSPVAEVGEHERRDFFPSVLLERWQLAAAPSQAIVRDQQTIAILVCCFRRSPAAVRIDGQRLLAAIADQAAVALQNARLIEEARAANRLKSEFVATLSHELRTPLNVVLGYLDLLRDGAYPNPEEQRDVLDRIYDHSVQLADLIKALLDVNRLDAGRMPITVEEFRIDFLFDSLRAQLPLNHPDVQLKWETPDGSAWLRTDEAKVEMILRNLIHNALKFTERGAVTVTAELQRDAQTIRLAVADTGPGIAAQDLSIIFEMFRQGSRTASSSGGVGLGLYIAKRLSEALGGSISVESRLGAGTRFTVLLPVSGGDHRGTAPYRDQRPLTLGDLSSQTGAAGQAKGGPKTAHDA